MVLFLPSADPQPLGVGLHRTDAFHRQPLFAVHPGDSSGSPVVVRSWPEAHALHGPARLEHVNPAYVGALVRQRHDAATAPYRRIRRLPRAHHVLIAPDGGLHTSPYDPLAGGAGPMPPEPLQAFLRQGLVDHLRQVLAGRSGLIGCEHSSGLDSNAVLGALLQAAEVPPERLHTWSLETGGEGPLLEQFRRFHGLIASHCHHADLLGRWQDPTGRVAEELRVFGAPAQIGGNPEAIVTLAEVGCRLLFSGFGGDQALSHNANNVPTDLVAQRRWRDLVRWVGSRRKALKIAAGRTLALQHRPWAEARVLAQTRQLGRSDLLERTLTEAGRAWLAPHLRSDYPWELDGYLLQRDSIRHRVLADWVAVRVDEESRMAAARGLAMAFPLLDERLIGTLLQQEPLAFGEGQCRGRLIHRRAFAPFLPPQLRVDPSKSRVPEQGLSSWREELAARRREAMERLLAAAGGWHPGLRRWWDLEAIRRGAEAHLESADVPLAELFATHRSIETLAGLSQWWEVLDD
jgi:hypothetical protein